MLQACGKHSRVRGCVQRCSVARLQVHRRRVVSVHAAEGESGSFNAGDVQTVTLASEPAVDQLLHSAASELGTRTPAPATTNKTSQRVASTSRTAEPRPGSRSSRTVSRVVVSNVPKQQSSLPELLLPGLAFFALAGGAAYWYLQGKNQGKAQTTKRSAASASLGLPGQGAGTGPKMLQREAQLRLQEFSDQLRSQQTADLSAKNLGDEGTAYVIEALAFNTNCLAVDLSKNGIAALGTAQLCQVLPTCALHTLVLNTNSLGDAGSEILAQGLSGNLLINKLDLGQNGIGDRGARALAEALKVNTALKQLDLSGNAVDVDGAAALAEALAVNNTLEILNLCDNYIGEKGAIAIGEAIKTNQSLKKIYLKGNEIGDKGAQCICDALKSRPGTIEVLDLGNNSITPEGIEHLAAFLIEKPELVELNLYMNDFGNAGMFKLAKAIQANTSLKILDLGGNNIGPEGAQHLVTALKSHPTLTSLELGYNPLGPEGIKTLVSVVKYDLKLDTLKLGWCQIGGYQGAAALADLICFNGTLCTLDLRGNALGNDGAIQISKALRNHTNTHLKELDLGYNEIKDEGACALAQAMKNNPEGAVRELKVNSNYIGRFGQIALSEAVDMVYEMGGGKMVTIHF